MATLSFKTIFQKLGKQFQQYFQENIETQKDIRGSAFIPSKGTVSGKRKKKISSGGTHPRLIVTGKTKKNAFKYEASDTELRLFVNEDVHSNNAKYSDIVFWNNKPTSANSKSPLIFPTIEKEMSLTKPYQEFDKMLDGEVQKYFKSVIGIDVKKEITIM
jgi:hypothetical protein